MSDEVPTPEEMMLLEELEKQYPKEDEKQNIFSFFKRVIGMKDTTKTSNLSEDELGFAYVPVRTWKEIALYCEKQGLTGLGTYFAAKAHIITDSSLSKEGFLDKLAVTQKREMETRARRFSEAQKRNWFGRKKPEQELS